MKKYIYVLFSATPYKTGGFIRRMIRNHYNHVALSLDRDFSSMYSFSRYHQNTPFFAGFVKESFSRYEWQGDFSDIKVCRIEVSERIYELMRMRLERMCSQADAYVYNYYSAAMTLFHQRVKIRNAYTCVEFVGDLLSMTDLDIKYGEFHSLPKLEAICTPYMIYQGSAREYPAVHSFPGDDYQEKMPVSEGVLATAESFGRLTKRGIEDAYSAICDRFDVAVKR